MQVSRGFFFPASFCFSLNLTWEMQTLCFIFLLLKDMGWEGDFGDSDSWSSMLPYGSWTEMGRGCKEVSCNLLPGPCLDIAASHGVFCPVSWDVSLSWRTLAVLAACNGLWLRCFVKMDGGQGKPAWIMAFISNGEKMSRLSVVHCFSSLKHCFGEPSVRTA